MDLYKEAPMSRWQRRKHRRCIRPGVARFGDVWVCWHGHAWVFGPGGVGGGGKWRYRGKPEVLALAGGDS